MTVLAELSRWIREGPPSRLLPWRVLSPLERATVAYGYPRESSPLHLTLSDIPAKATLILGGDIALHRWNPELDVERVFGGLASLSRSADSCIINLEAQLSSHPTAKASVGSSLRAPPEALEVLTRLGVTAVTCANNHCLDVGSKGLSESIGRLESAGIGVAGIHSPASDGSLRLAVGGIRVGMLAYADDWRVLDEPETTHRPVPHDPEAVRQDIVRLKPTVDLVMVQLHWGYEWAMYPMRSLRDLARSYIDAGASLVVAHHAHVPMAIESWQGGVIAHGLGNLYFGRSTRPAHPFRYSSFMLRVGLAQNRVVGAEVVPVRTDEAGRVGPALAREARRLHDALGYLGRRLHEDAYLESVERALEFHHAGLVLLEVVKRLQTADQQGVLEWSRFMTTPRQRNLVKNLFAGSGMAREMGAMLDRLREQPGEFQGPARARELEGLAYGITRRLGRQKPTGQIP